MNKRVAWKTLIQTYYIRALELRGYNNPWIARFLGVDVATIVSRKKNSGNIPTKAVMKIFRGKFKVHTSDIKEQTDA
jgi:hypothetical protein